MQEPKLSSRYMTKYELARLLGERAHQLAMGATPAVTLTSKDNDPLAIAKRELDVQKSFFLCS